MINIESIIDPEELKDLRYACAYLFSPSLAMEEGFLNGLTSDAINEAFSDKSKRYDPFIKRDEQDEVAERRRLRFEKIKQALDIFKKYFIEGEIVSIASEEDLVELSEVELETDSAQLSKIIAIGGAKGGIGKSVFTTNLGVYLAQTGKKVILIDLDLGGSSLNLYLGIKTLKLSINDYLNGKIKSIDEALIKTKYGPYLIGGDSSQLGSANIQYMKKLKLIRAIKKLKADYIILDLGASTTYNMIDFFLFADEGIIITTPDPPAYMEAYASIKVALFRKLNRMFSCDSSLQTKKDYQLLKIIKDATFSGNGNKINKVSELLDLIDDQHPEGSHLVKRVLKNFRPKLVVNMKDLDSDDLKVASRLQNVSKSMLNLSIEYVCSIDSDKIVKESVRSLVPVIYSYPDSNFSLKMKVFAQSILN